MPDYNFTIGDYTYKPKFSPKILTGQVFGRLLVIGFAGHLPVKRNRAAWYCLCDCGNGTTVRYNALQSGHTTSCGCKRRKPENNITYNKRPTPEYRSYQLAKNRCTNPNYRKYKDYGGRGIEFRFTSFAEFFSEVGKRPTLKHSIDRIDNEGHYEKGNIQWATKRTQESHKRTSHMLTAFGVTQCIAEWERAGNARYGRIHTRLKNRWCVECAVSIPTGGDSCPHRI